MQVGCANVQSICYFMSTGFGLAYVVLDVGEEDVPDDGDHVDV